MNSSPLKNLSFLDTVRSDEFFDHTRKRCAHNPLRETGSFCPLNVKLTALLI